MAKSQVVLLFPLQITRRTNVIQSTMHGSVVKTWLTGSGFVPPNSTKAGGRVHQNETQELEGSHYISTEHELSDNRWSTDRAHWAIWTGTVRSRGYTTMDTTCFLTLTAVGELDNPLLNGFHASLISNTLPSHLRSTSFEEQLRQLYD